MSRVLAGIIPASAVADKFLIGLERLLTLCHSVQIVYRVASKLNGDDMVLVLPQNEANVFSPVEAFSLNRQ